MSFTRSLIRWGLISGLALGGLTLLIGPHKVAYGLHQIRAQAQMIVDRAVDEPAALRHQLERMADQYPDRIATVRGELAEVEHQLSQFNRDAEISTRVVAMTTQDLTELKTLVVRVQNVSNPSDRPIVRFKGVRFDVPQAFTEAQRINDVRINYQDRAASNVQQISMLTEQKLRLTDICDQLESEYATFQTQMWQLDSQIDAIERNDRLIAMTEDMQATLDSYDRWGEIGNLKQLEGKLAELRTIQKAQLDTLRQTGLRIDYAKEAASQIDSPNGVVTPSHPFDNIDVNLEANEDAPVEVDSFAWFDK
jgi:chromosome segregation ATPase